jgi:hypothetical protein
MDGATTTGLMTTIGVGVHLRAALPLPLLVLL